MWHVHSNPCVMVRSITVPLNGDSILPSIVEFARSLFQCSNDSSCLSYTSFISRKMDKPNKYVTFQEECSFYLYWLCKFMVCSSLKRITLGFTSIAIALASGHWLALGPFLLSILYWFLFSFTRERFSDSLNEPLWLLQLWIYAYFLSLALVPLNY